MKMFKIEKNKVYVTSNVLKIYLPIEYFEYDIAEDKGTSVETLGIFYMEECKDESSKGKFFLYKFPVSINIAYTKLEKEETVIKGNEGVFNVIYLKKGDLFLENINIIETFKDAYKFITLLNAGKLPTNVGYSNIMDLYHKALIATKTDLGVPSFTLETIVSELARQSKDRTQAFRKQIGKNGSKVSETDFVFIRDKEIAHLNSTFEAITFEDINKALITSSVRKKEGTNQTESPLEKVLRY